MRPPDGPETAASWVGPETTLPREIRELVPIWPESPGLAAALWPSAVPRPRDGTKPQPAADALSARRCPPAGPGSECIRQCSPCCSDGVACRCRPNVPDSRLWPSLWDVRWGQNEQARCAAQPRHRCASALRHANVPHHPSLAITWDVRGPRRSRIRPVAHLQAADRAGRALVRAQEREDRHHAAVVRGRLAESELEEDLADVGLTVRGLRNSRSPMPSLEWPSAMRESTSPSRSVTCSSGPARRRATRRETIVGSTTHSGSRTTPGAERDSTT
jgi:hypothetical protein